MSRKNSKLNHFETEIYQNYTRGKEKCKLNHFEIKIGQIYTRVKKALSRSNRSILWLLLPFRFIFCPSSCNKSAQPPRRRARVKCQATSHRPVKLQPQLQLSFIPTSVAGTKNRSRGKGRVAPVACTLYCFSGQTVYRKRR